MNQDRLIKAALHLVICRDLTEPHANSDADLELAEEEFDSAARDYVVGISDVDWREKAEESEVARRYS